MQGCNNSEDVSCTVFHDSILMIDMVCNSATYVYFMWNWMLCLLIPCPEKYSLFFLKDEKGECDKLDWFCQVGLAGVCHWPVSDRDDAYCDMFDMYVCVCARGNGGPDLVCVTEACLIRVICVNCGIWNLGIYQLLRISDACYVCPSCELWLDLSPALVMSVSKWGYQFRGNFCVVWNGVDLLTGVRNSVMTEISW